MVHNLIFITRHKIFYPAILHYYGRWKLVMCTFHINKYMDLLQNYCCGRYCLIQDHRLKWAESYCLFNSHQRWLHRHYTYSTDLHDTKLFCYVNSSLSYFALLLQYEDGWFPRKKAVLFPLTKIITEICLCSNSSITLHSITYIISSKTWQQFHSNTVSKKDLRDRVKKFSHSQTQMQYCQYKLQSLILMGYIIF